MITFTVEFPLRSLNEPLGCLRHVEVHGADIQDGILAIELKYVIPEDQRPRKINIGQNEEHK